MREDQKMKITAIEPIYIGIPYKHDAPKTRLGTGQVRELMDAVYLKVETDAGITGWGEAFGFSACAIAHAACDIVLKPLALGQKADDIQALMTDLYRKTQGLSLNGPARNAFSALDIALWDIKGKAEGKPSGSCWAATVRGSGFPPTPVCCAPASRSMWCASVVPPWSVAIPRSRSMSATKRPSSLWRGRARPWDPISR
jgi:L-alanine-DL-glutamate epimerase-like enolase superfamily enzyme